MFQNLDVAFFYLLRYAKGPAHSLVKGCQYMNTDLGYTKARELLQQTFGQKFQIVKACIDSVTNGPLFYQNDKVSLLRFSSEINSCINTLKGMNYLDKMNNLTCLVKSRNGSHTHGKVAGKRT